jgi:putative DNA primase/helicase
VIESALDTKANHFKDLPMSIFSKTAPAYLKLGVSVIPLQANSKVPVPTGWTDYADHPIPANIQKEWLHLPANHNIGLVLGKQSGVSVLDIDIEDDLMVSRIVKLLPQSPWHRRGRKGLVLAFKHTPDRDYTFRLKDKQGKTLIEFLSSGTQVVLPPSIHPDTMQPYVANADLVQLLKADALPTLPDNLEELIHDILTSCGLEVKTGKGVGALTEFVPAGDRDNRMTQRAGALAIDVVRGFMTLKRAINTMHAFNDGFTEQVAGDSMDMHKHVRNMIGFIRNDLRARNCAMPIGWDEGLTEEERTNLNLVLPTEVSYEVLETSASIDIDNSGNDKLGAMREILQKMANIRQVDNLKEGMLLEKMVKKFKGEIKLRDVKKELAELKERSLAFEVSEEGNLLELNTHTQVAIAAIEYQNNLGELRSQDGIMYRWTNSHWEEVNETMMQEWVSTRYVNCPVLKRASDIQGIWKMMLLQTYGRSLRTDNRPFINVANGVVLYDGTLIDFDKEFGATYVLPYRYTRDAECPIFLDFLHQSWHRDPDYQDKLKALQEAICATLLGYATKFQRAFLLIGKANSGKSVLLEVIANMFPTSARSSVSFNKLQDGSLFVSIDKKLINVVGELSEKQKIKGDLFKSLIDGSETVARRLYSPAFNMRPIAAHWAASNHLPKTDDSSAGFTRRWLMFKFNHVVAKEDVDINLASKIICNEKEGIFRWALEALPRLTQGKGNYTLCASHLSAVNALTYNVNPVLFFLEKSDTLKKGPEEKITEEELWYSFRMFFMRNIGGRNHHDMCSFRSMLEEVMDDQKIVKIHKMDDVRTWYSGVSLASGIPC